MGKIFEISYCWIRGYLHGLVCLQNHLQRNCFIFQLSSLELFDPFLHLFGCIVRTWTYQRRIRENRWSTCPYETVNDVPTTPSRKERPVISSEKRIFIDSEILPRMKNCIHGKRGVIGVRHLLRLSHHGAIFRKEFVRARVLEYVGPDILRALRKAHAVFRNCNSSIPRQKH